MTHTQCPKTPLHCFSGKIIRQWRSTLVYINYTKFSYLSWTRRQLCVCRHQCGSTSGQRCADRNDLQISPDTQAIHAGFVISSPALFSLQNLCLVFRKLLPVSDFQPESSRCHWSSLVSVGVASPPSTFTSGAANQSWVSFTLNRPQLSSVRSCQQSRFVGRGRRGQNKWNM